MQRICITFSGSRYHGTTEKIVHNSPKYGADAVYVYDDHWLSTRRPDFMKAAEPLFKHHATRGYGWFAWKPFIILDALRRWPDAAILFMDADTYPVHDLSAVFNVAERDGLMLFSAVGHYQVRWCKRDCYILMGQDDPKYYDVQHGVARFMAFTKAHIPFLEEWLKYTLDIRCNTFDRSKLAPELPAFHEHRCEQAIMTNLAFKYGHKLYREACQFGESSAEDRDMYPQLFIQDGNYTHAQKACAGSAFRNVND